MQKIFIFTLFLLMGCTGPEVFGPPKEERKKEYIAPSWLSDASIALINSKISVANRPILLMTMRNIVDTEISNYDEQTRKLADLIRFQEELLQRAVEAYPEREGPIKGDEENFISYYASSRIRIEMLKIQLLYEVELARIRLAMKRLSISLPEDN